MLKKLTFKRSEFRTTSEKASHDWKQIVLLFSLLSVFVIGGGLYTFVLIVKGDFFKPIVEQTSIVKRINQKDLSAITKFFKDEKAQTVDISAVAKEVGDPSL